ncbi:hypothetical protein BG003_011815 [Podila horticola]|nr:hypothetical protein BG003_011815 [Podila horticola]
MRMHHQNQFGTGNYAGRPATASNKNPHINLRDPALPSQTTLDSDLFTTGGMTRPHTAAFPCARFIQYLPVPTDNEPEPAPSSKNGASTNTTSSSHGNNNRKINHKSKMSSPVRHSRSVYKKQPYPKSTKKTSRSLPDFCNLPSFRKAASTVNTGSSSTAAVNTDSSASMSRRSRISMIMDGPLPSSSCSSSPSSLKVTPTEESSVSRPKSIGRINMVPFRPVANRKAPVLVNSCSKDKVSSHGPSVSAIDSFMGADAEMDMATSYKQDLPSLASKAIMHKSPEPMEDVYQPISNKRPHSLDRASHHCIISMSPTPLSTHPGLSPSAPPSATCSTTSSSSAISPHLPISPISPRVATPIDFRTSFNALSVNHSDHKSAHGTQPLTSVLPSQDIKTDAHTHSQAPTTPPTTPPFYSPKASERVHYVDDQFEYDECLITKVVSPTEGIVYYNSDIDVDNRATHQVKDRIKDEIKSEEHYGSKKTLKITQFFHSDGSSSRFPKHPNIRELRMDDEQAQEWLSRAMLTSLPYGYRLFEELRTRRCLLFGHVEGAFKDPEQFIPHALWLSSADCTYSKDSIFCDILHKIKPDYPMYTQQDHNKNEIMDMDMEGTKAEDIEGDSCAHGHSAQQLPSPVEGPKQGATACALSTPYAASHGSQSSHSRRVEQEWSPHVLGPFFPVQPKKHKSQSLREIRIAQGQFHK